MKTQWIKPAMCTVIVVLTAWACENIKDSKDDIDQTAALRNVNITYENCTYQLGLPEGALDGQTFNELLDIDSGKFANPANYTISFVMNLNADNTSADARDAKFDGMLTNLVMDTITSTPLSFETNAFTVAKGENKQVPSEATINLETHKTTGLYVFKQTVAGSDLATTISPVLMYNIGSLEKSINIPDIQQDIPTRASDETKTFLRELLASGILDE